MAERRGRMICSFVLRCDRWRMRAHVPPRCGYPGLLLDGLTAPSSTDVSGQPPPFSRPQGVTAGDTWDC